MDVGTTSVGISALAARRFSVAGPGLSIPLSFHVRGEVFRVCPQRCIFVPYAMKILSVSDRIEPLLNDRDAPRRYEGVELILACGDLPPEYLAFLRHVFDVPVFYVAGNHDIRYPERPPTGCTNLHSRFVKFKKIKMIGFEGSRWYSGGRYQYTEAQMRRTALRLVPIFWWHKRIDIVLAHAPPRFVHDAEDRCHRGFKTYRSLIEWFSPRYFIHGHIHTEFENDAQRMTVIKETKVINSYGHVLFEIDPYRPKD